MRPMNASLSGIFQIGDAIRINRLGFGAMRITGRGIWGPPADRAEAIKTLQRLPALGVNFIDTADSYGPDVSEQLIREALHPYNGMLIATKAGLTRSGPDRWTPRGDAKYLLQQARKSCSQLGVEQLQLWQLHRIDPRVPRAEQFGAVRTLLDDGIIRHAGLSEVSIRDIEEASRYFPVTTVQNRFNLVDRSSEDVLDFCAARGIGFIPWNPLATGSLGRPGTALDEIAVRHAATPAQIALAWMLKRSPVMLPIPGTSRTTHLEENVAAAAIDLSDIEFKSLDSAAARPGKRL